MGREQGLGRRARGGREAVAVGLAGLVAILAAAPAAAGGELATAALTPQVRSAPVPAIRAQPEDLSPGLRVETATTYTVDLAGSQVLVEHVATLTNETPDEISGGVRYETYFADYRAPVLVGAVDLRAERGDGRALRVGTEDGDGVVTDWAVVDLAPDLFFGQSQQVRLTYRMPTQPLRSGAVAQVNPAIATFPVFTLADPGLGSVSILVPDGLGVDLGGAQMTSSSGQGSTVYAAETIADPTAWGATVLVRDDDALVERLVFHQDTGVLLLGWPGDDEWLEVTADLVERGLPALREAMGTAWRQPGQLEIVESTAPYLYGYAGWYERSSSVIEIGDQLDPHVTLHELSHAWFNEKTFQGRWLNEALANEFAALTMVELGMERPVPQAPGSAGALPLNAWADVDLDSPQAQEQEVYGYNAAWWVAHQLAQEIGADGLGEVVQAAADRVSPYPASGTSRLDEVADWRSFLDLAETVGGSTALDALVRELVATEDDRALMELRTPLREDYAALVEAGRGWAPPAALRQAMTDWDFEAAARLVPRARELYERRDAVAAVLAEVDMTVPGALQRLFEDAQDLAALEQQWEDVERAADVLVDARRTAGGPLGRLRLVVSGAQRDLGAVRAALEQGDAERAGAAAERAADALPRVSVAGSVAAGAVVVLLVAAIVGVGVLRRRRTPGHVADVGELPQVLVR